MSSDLGAPTASTGAGALAATAGCGKTPTLRSGTQSIQTSGKNRSFILRIPDNYNNNTPYRLIFGFHWLGGTATEVDSGGTSGYPWSFYGLRQLSNNGAIFVAPQGFNNGWANANGEDVVFVDDMIKRIETDLCVDTSQRFATGFSYGGGMSYSLACSRATVFRAVAVFSGAQLSGCGGGTQPIAYMGLHGIGDTVLNISQGRSLRDTFVRNNGCTPQNPPEPSTGSRTHIVTAYSGCRSGYPVVWAAFDNGHMPGPVDGTYTESGITTWTKGEVWKFFSQFGSTPSPSPTPTPTPTPTPVPGGCAATIETVNSWSGGFQSTVTVRAGNSAISGWTVDWTWPGGQTISSLWNGVRSGSGANVTVRNESYNGSIATNGTTTFGFTANGTAATPALSCSAS
ncbi:cellulose binding domain-containing protein [Sphaerisporangium sp. NPDC049002]|uniref:cellulose binding domain-containing protein n=1 Tax=unclassified Sphaerisporangium TaxID=2630420 RepID=UPI0033FA1CD8